MNPFQANVIRYVVRYEDKNGIEDLEKIIHHCEMEIEPIKKNKQKATEDWAQGSSEARRMTHQLNFIYNDSDWVAPSEYPDLREADEVAIDLETKDPELKKIRSGWATGKGHIVGFAVAVLGKQWYFPIAHDGNMI